MNVHGAGGLCARGSGAAVAHNQVLVRRTGDLLDVSPTLIAVSLRHYRTAEAAILRAWGLRAVTS